MTEPLGLADLLFGLIAGLTLLGGCGVALSRDILYSALSLMATFLGTAGLFLFLAADFVAVVQVLVYVGGILVLMLFAVMLTHRIADRQVSNRALHRLPAAALLLGLGAVMARAILEAPWRQTEPGEALPTTAALGNLFLDRWLLPFEFVSLILLATLLGAVALSRREAGE